MNIVTKVENHFKEKLPFVAYRKPGAANVLGLFQETDMLHTVSDYAASGFVFAPFDSARPSILIPTSTSQLISESWEPSGDIASSAETDHLPIENTKNQHLDLVTKAIEEIRTNRVKKIVISRKEQLQLKEIDCCTIFLRLLMLYPSAMVYLWYHPKVGVWIGATPETLLTLKDRYFSTMSLAATRPYKNTLDVSWNTKEIEEQSLVTDFIETELNKVVTTYKVHPRETVRAGNVVHLRTLLTGEIKDEKEGLKNLIKALHPTPAVCGMPRNLAKEFIMSQEDYDRSYYTGFLGELHLKGSSELYVNLRCMQMNDMKASLYIGGGITADSVPEEEWEETKLKTKTLKKVL